MDAGIGGIMITALKPNQIFVFGSNLAGIHGAGAAKQAREQFGAQLGVGEGLTGRSYAFPSLDKTLRIRTWAALWASRDRLWACCNANPGKEFLLTKVGCGIAGYPEAKMKDLFYDAPANIIKPLDWDKEPKQTPAFQGE